MKIVEIITKSGSSYFEIDEIRSGYSVNMIDYNRGLLGGLKRVLEKIGETKSIEDAITLAKIRVKEPIVDMKVK